MKNSAAAKILGHISPRTVFSGKQNKNHVNRHEDYPENRELVWQVYLAHAALAGFTVFHNIIFIVHDPNFP